MGKVAKDKKPDVGMKSQLESEAEAPQPEASEEIPGGVNSSDPSIADGASEVDAPPWNPPTEE